MDTDALPIISIEVDEELQELIPMFMERRKGDLGELRSSFATGDLAAIARIGHAMKGSGGGFGFDRVSELGGSLEAAGQCGDRDTIASALDELESFLSRVRVTYV